MLKVLNYFDSWQAAVVSGAIAGVLTFWFIRRTQRSRHHFGPFGTAILAIFVFAILFAVVFFAFI
jgi:hypothetical protein